MDVNKHWSCGVAMSIRYAYGDNEKKVFFNLMITEMMNFVKKIAFL